jgi:DNA-binding PadR family transcriptional regulator
VYDGQKFLTLTAKGEEALRQWKIEELKLDIASHQREARDLYSKHRNSLARTLRSRSKTAPSRLTAAFFLPCEVVLGLIKLSQMLKGEPS